MLDSNKLSATLHRQCAVQQLSINCARPRSEKLILHNKGWTELPNRRDAPEIIDIDPCSGRFPAIMFICRCQGAFVINGLA